MSHNEEKPILETVFERACRKLVRDIGQDVLGALYDKETVEIVCNADGMLWQEKLGHKMQQIGYMRPSLVQSIIETVAGCYGKEVTKQTPLLESEFPLDGSRFAGQIPPVVGAPIFAIRKRAVRIFSLQDYVDAGSMHAWQKEVICSFVARKKNILVTGGTGSGKTTLVNAIIQEITRECLDERIFIIEDTGEIQCAALNKVHYHTTREIGMKDLLRASLRMRPDRILVGEVRGPEALDLLMAWNTGHEGGAATIHANNARAGLDRLHLLISMHPAAPRFIEPLIGEVVHLVVPIGRYGKTRRVEDMLVVSGYEEGKYNLTPIQEDTAKAFIEGKEDKKNLETKLDHAMPLSSATQLSYEKKTLEQDRHLFKNMLEPKELSLEEKACHIVAGVGVEESMQAPLRSGKDLFLGMHPATPSQRLLPLE